ncbi:hypothetical protein KR009_012392 [Drosophila setifemur]|nr:hypothetical protein KR009_012392 [Drosophila setifemur]
MVDRGNNLVLPVGPCSTEATETQMSFCPPKIKKVVSTRANRMDKYLWQEMFEEYIRQASAPVDLGENHTEYYDQFCKDSPPKDEEKEEILISKYPLYCTTAVTLWNHKGDPTKTFKRKYAITKPIQECTEKFAP